MESFIVTLPSNVKSFDNNRIGNYRTLLPHRIDLVGEWDVALKEISYTKSWYNITEDHEIEFLKMHWKHPVGSYKGLYKYRNSTLSRGHYERKELIAKLNSIFQNDTTDTEKQHAKIVLEEHSNQLIIEPGIGNHIYTYPLMDKKLCEILGFSQNSTESDLLNYFFSFTNPYGSNQFSDKPLDVSYGIHSLFVYSDIAQGNIVGNTYAKLLRVVEIPNVMKFGNQIVIHYENPQFVPIGIKSFEEIEIDIKDDAGETIAFEYGRVIITLHFRKKV